MLNISIPITIILSVCLLVSPVLAFEFNPLDNFELEVCEPKEGLFFIVDTDYTNMTGTEVACHVFVQVVAVGSIASASSAIIPITVVDTISGLFSRCEKDADDSGLISPSDLSCTSSQFEEIYHHTY